MPDRRNEHPAFVFRFGHYIITALDPQQSGSNGERFADDSDNTVPL